ncbi:hypothetical protein H4R35_001873 [Dimargaris xerosporica]|nr:hypothetical protein H4R35_001873 [Dimargaris xerosporica]
MYKEQHEEVAPVEAGAHTYPNQFSDDEDDYSVNGSEHGSDGDVPKPVKIHIPDPVRSFLTHLQNNVYENNAHELYVAYEHNFNRLTERFYAKQSWPHPQYIGSMMNDDGIFLTLYRELYYRHIYARLQPTLEDRFHSYENYCDLFNFILNSDGPVALELPNQWLWDVVDEFIYQFQAFCAYRNRFKRKTEEELYLLKENPQMWSCYSVLNVLYSLIQKSNITEQLLVSKNGGDVVAAAGDYGSRPLYKMLGYFSIIGLLRVHCLLGDYTMALKMMENIEMSNKAIYTRVTACHVTTHYYVGFAYMMMRRYADAIRTFSQILTFMSRTKQYHTRTYQYQGLNKRSDQIYALLAMCVALCPTRLDEHLHSYLRDKYGEKQQRMHRGGDEAVQTFEELFRYACPKFITATSPDYDDVLAYLKRKSSSKDETGSAYDDHSSGEESEAGSEDDEGGDAVAPPQVSDPHRHQTMVFVNEARYQLLIPTLRSYLKLYSTMGIGKLAAFLEIDDEQHLRHQMLLFKLRSRQKKWQSGSLLEGEWNASSDLDFYLSQDVIHIAESKVGRRFADWFIRHINRLDDTMANLKKSENTHAAAIQAAAKQTTLTGGAKATESTVAATGTTASPAQSAAAPSTMA